MATTERGLEREQAGQSLAELSFVLVLFLVLLFGIVDAGRLIFAYYAVSAGAREGVRWAVVRGATSPLGTATKDDIKAFVQNSTVGTTVDVDATWTPDSLPGSTVAVTVTSPFSPIAPFPMVPKTLTLSSTSSMVISR